MVFRPSARGAVKGSSNAESNRETHRRIGTAQTAVKWPLWISNAAQPKFSLRICSLPKSRFLDRPPGCDFAGEVARSGGISPRFGDQGEAVTRKPISATDCDFASTTGPELTSETEPT